MRLQRLQELLLLVLVLGSSVVVALAVEKKPVNDDALGKVKQMIVHTIARSQDAYNELKKEADFCKEQMEETEGKLKKQKESAKKARDAYEDAKAENQKVLDAELAEAKSASLLLRKKRSAPSPEKQKEELKKNQELGPQSGARGAPPANALSTKDRDLAPAAIEAITRLRKAEAGRKKSEEVELAAAEDSPVEVMKTMREQQAATRKMGEALQNADKPYEEPEKPLTKTEKKVLARKKELEKEDAALANTQKAYDTLYNRCVAMGPSREETMKKRKKAREQEIDNLKEAHELLDDMEPR